LAALRRSARRRRPPHGADLAPMIDAERGAAGGCRRRPRCCCRSCGSSSLEGPIPIS
jgi:hypothetical protein